jgi:DNA polymerase-1
MPKDLHRPYQIDLDLIPVLAEMEWRGMAVDRSRLDQALGILDREIDELLDQIESLSGRRIRPTNPNDIRELLFDIGLLPDRSSSVDKDVLQGLLVDYPKHPLISAIVQVRQRVTLRSSFVQKLPKLVNPVTGRIHPSFNTVNTETGRLSCSDPNLQNIPRRSSLGKAIRLAFIGSPSLIVADKSQIEPRILAHVTADPGLRDIFANDLDLYRMVGSRIFGKDPDEITDHERSLMKVVTLATQYGATGWTIARRASDPLADPPFVMTPQEGDAFLSAYLSAYPGIKAWMDRVIADARHTGFSVTEIGNRRYLPGITSPDPVERREAERQAINHPIQGLAAYLMKLVLISLHRDGIPVTNSVHDEVVVESNDPSLIPLIRERIESCYPLSVPIRAEIGMGSSWAEAKP